MIILMSLSLVGIILVQLFWINTSYKNNEEQFKYHVQQVIGSVANKLQQQEYFEFYEKFNKLKDSIGKVPRQSEQIIYSNTIVLEDYNLNRSFFDKKSDSVSLKSFVAKRKTEIYNGNVVDNSSFQKAPMPDVTIEKEGNLDILDKAQFEIYFKDIVGLKPIQERVSKDKLQLMLRNELNQYGVNTPFEFGIYSNMLATKVKSENFNYDKNSTYSIPVFPDNEGQIKYQLFTLVIIVAYFSALNQLIKQKQISEIKTDFINNMTHEFKTPIATINLALDAIKNPKIIDDKEKVQRYLQMIRDENKRMHAQVENVLRISKLEKRELEISKEPTDVHTIIEDAIEHVNLIVEDRGGVIKEHLNAKRTTILLNDVHFTNVMVNILDNAIKYSPEAPIIDVTTENVKDFVLIKIKDNGAGMSKVAQKRIFEKFYREHTGDLHNVKGHGLGLAYVKRIIEDHNGQIFVESEKGKGSTFIIKMPLIN